MADSDRTLSLTPSPRLLRTRSRPSHDLREDSASSSASSSSGATATETDTPGERITHYPVVEDATMCEGYKLCDCDFIDAKVYYDLQYEHIHIHTFMTLVETVLAYNSSI